MATLTEGQHRGEFIVSEANGHRSRETVTLAGGQNLAAGTVVGQLTAGGAYTQIEPDADPVDGSEIASAILFDNVDATDGPLPAVVIARDAEVNGAELVWPVGIAPADKTAALSQLADVGLIVR